FRFFLRDGLALLLQARGELVGSLRVRFVADRPQGTQDHDRAKDAEYGLLAVLDQEALRTGVLTGDALGLVGFLLFVLFGRLGFTGLGHDRAPDWFQASPGLDPDNQRCSRCFKDSPLFRATQS